jgi:cytochrome c
MESSEPNKIMMAALGTMTFALALNIAVGGIYAPKKPAVPGYDLPAAEEGAPDQAAAQAPSEPLPVLLAKADPGKGEKLAAACTQCHILQKTAPAGQKKIGPSLYGVVGRPIASVEGFNYSPDLKSKGGNWDPELISQFVAAPKKFAPRTLMAYPGMPKAEQRADLIAFLNTLSDNPQPLAKAQ